jgi:hypothetical protein
MRNASPDGRRSYLSISVGTTLVTVAAMFQPTSAHGQRATPAPAQFRRH